MDFKSINYLCWAKLNMGHATTSECNLADVQMECPAVDELGLSVKDLKLCGNNYFGYNKLLEIISKTYDVNTSNIMVTLDANMALFMVFAYMIDKSSKVLLETPNYEPVYKLLEYFGAEIDVLEREYENNFTIDLNAFERKMSKNTKCVIMSNIHNPSGKAIWEDKLRTIGQISRDYKSYLICDETFREVSLTEPVPMAFKLVENSISIGTLSKIFGGYGLRLGWIIAKESIIKELRRIENYFGGIPFVTEEIAVNFFEKYDYFRDKATKRVKDNIDIIENWLNKEDRIKWVKPDGGTCAFLKLPVGIKSTDFVKHLDEKYNTLVVPGEFFWAKGFFRIGTVASENVLPKGLQNISHAIDDLLKM